MTPSTAELIDDLATDAEAVGSIAPPTRRTLLWLTAAALLIAALAGIFGLRPDLAQLLHDPMFDVGRSAALLTGIAAAIATFRVSVPGRSLAWLWLPMPFAPVWVGTMGYGCLLDWSMEGENGLQLGHSYECFIAILATSLPLGALLLFMVRHAARVSRIPTAIAGGIALAALTEAGLTLYHHVDATSMDILVHLAAIAIVVAVSIAGSARWFHAVDLFRG
jgi:hypothetical protein